jgi:ketosteroid isomerase-like protein
MNAPIVSRICHGLIVVTLACARLSWGASADDQDRTRAALDQQRKEFEAAITRTDAVGLGRLFASDAKLMVSDFDAVVGREAIQKVWQFALGSGAVARLDFKPDDLDGLGGELPVETGTLVIFDKEGKERGRNNYVLVWKREEGTWKIYRDIASTTSAPAPTADRVGFPRDYRTQLKTLTGPTFNSKSGVVQTAFGNDPAALVATTGKPPYPHGSVLVMEFAQAVKDGVGHPLRDADGHPQRGAIVRVDVMRRGAGFGEAYGKKRAGEWEFVSYNVDGSFSTPPARSASCAECHLNKAGAAKDFVFPLTSAPKM